MDPVAAPVSPLRLAFSLRVIANSPAVAVMVGTALNLINQGDRLFSGAAPDLGKPARTYVVPFLVSTYGAWNMARDPNARQRPKA